MSDPTSNADQANDADTQDGAYRVLARKYRPSNFDDLIGQEAMVRTLTNAFATGRIAQAYMLTGVRGVGKTTTARILARALNYKTDEIDRPSLDLSQPGEHCAAIMEGNHVDVIEMDAASHTGINDIREIIAAVRYRPVSARYKVYIIDEVHMLSGAAFNGLLKTLEEPPEHVKFIFATTEIRKVPVTVLSRCQRFDLRRIEAGELTQHLQSIAQAEKVEAQEDALALIARAGEGSVRDALSLFDQAIAHAAGAGGGVVEAEAVRDMLGLADRARVIDLFEHLMGGDIAAALAELKDQYDSGADPATVLIALAEFVHFVTRLRYVPTAADDPSLSEQERTRGKTFAEKLTPRILGRTWQMLLKGINEVQAAARPLPAADMVLVRIAHAADLPSLDEALKRLDAGGQPSGNAPAPRGGAPASPAQQQAPAHAPTAIATSTPDDGARMRRVAGGPALVVDNAPAAATAPAPLQAVREEIATFQDLLDVCERKRDRDLKLMLRNNFSEIEFEPGRITFELIGKPHRDLRNHLERRLREWTGEAWNITIRTGEGGSTLQQQEAVERERSLSDAEADPVVAAVLRAFPKSKIVAVKVPNAEPDGPEAEPAIADGEPIEDTDDPGVSSLDDYFN